MSAEEYTLEPIQDASGDGAAEAEPVPAREDAPSADDQAQSPTLLAEEVDVSLAGPASEDVVTAADDDEGAPIDEAGESQPAAESQAAPEADEAQAAAEPDAPGSEILPEGEPAAEPTGPERQWFVVHGYSGYENRVKKNLEQRIESMGMQGKIFQVIVPTEEEIEVKGGERRVVERRVFPGYILVEMIMDETSWYVVRNTPGVTGFVGSGNRPAPLSAAEVEKIMKRIETAEPTIKVSFKVGQKVRLTEGAFVDFVGLVDELYPEKGRARVLVSMFGRDTPLEVDLLQLERV